MKKIDGTELLMEIDHLETTVETQRGYIRWLEEQLRDRVEPQSSTAVAAGEN